MRSPPITTRSPASTPIGAPPPRAALIGLCITLTLSASCRSGGPDTTDRDVSTGATPTTIDAPAAIATTMTPLATPATTQAPTATLASTTTLAPARVYVAEACAVLSEAGFETRRVVLAESPGAHADAGGVGDAREALAAQCAPSVERLEAAQSIRDRMDAIAAGGPEAQGHDPSPLGFADFACDDGSFAVRVTNQSDVAVGVHADFKIVAAEDREDPIQSSYSPIVVWSLASGASETITGSFAAILGRPVRCQFQAQVFDADTSDSDASLGVPTHPALTGDDPAAWLPALLAVERAAVGTGDADMAAATEDVRSVAYAEVLARILDPAVAPVDDRDVGEIEVCERGRSQPDPDRISLVYREVWDDGSRMRHGLFRRGLDGQWRWLSTARYFASSILDDCRFVDLRPGEFIDE